MRTTLTLDDDVALQIGRLRRARQLGLRDIVNEALRRGLAEMARATDAHLKPYRTRVFDLGAAKIPSLDNVADVLAPAKDEDFR